MKESDIKLLDILAKTFELETLYSSRPETHHPCYKTIVAMGKRAPEDIIPWLLVRVEENWHWPQALQEIVGDDASPVIPREFAGQIDFIAAQWKYWGKIHGYLVY